MTVLAGRRESFNAVHQLCDPDLSDEENRRLSGKCANLHGHNYVLEVAAASETRGQRLTITPFPRPGRHTTWEPYRQTIQTTDGVLVAGRRDPAPHPGDSALAAA